MLKVIENQNRQIHTNLAVFILSSLPSPSFLPTFSLLSIPPYRSVSPPFGRGRGWVFPQGRGRGWVGGILLSRIRVHSAQEVVHTEIGHQNAQEGQHHVDMVSHRTAEGGQ